MRIFAQKKSKFVVNFQKHKNLQCSQNIHESECIGGSALTVLESLESRSREAAYGCGK